MTDRPPLVLLHTTDSNRPAFQALLDALAPDVPVRHRVHEELLAEALAAGRLTDALRGRAAAALSAAGEGAGLVLCTCSTIGPAADDAAAAAAVPVLRIDRPMAEEAVRRARRIGVCATFPSTLEPTLELLRQAARDAGRQVTLLPHLFDEARAAFAAGARERYLDLVAAGLEDAAGDCELLVLAQASMAPALERAGDLGVPVLSSPRSGLAAAIERYRALLPA